MAEFNLVEGPWIPCISPDGNISEYSIRDVLLQSHNLSEICDDSPLVTVAIHRLLLAILYRALEGPNNIQEWRDLYQKHSFAQSRINEYLYKWEQKFNLLDQSYPFYQMSQLVTAKPISTNRLATEIASGNNATLFDHGGDDIIVEWTAPQAARYLVTCQSFALGFGKSGNAKINGINETLPYSSDAIALRGMNIWIQGENLFKTLMINLSPIKDISLPPWELENPNKYRDKQENNNRIVFGSFGLVDQLTWQSRLMRLIPDNQTISKMYFTQGRSADKCAIDPMKVYRLSKDEGVSALAFSSNKSAWRDFHSILMIPESGSKEHRPECFNMAEEAISNDDVNDSKIFITHVAGLATAPNKAGKFIFWRHERMPVPAALLNNTDLLERLGKCLAYAERAAGVLKYRIQRVIKLYLSPDCELPGGHQPDPSDIAKLIESLDPRPAYWSRMEDHFMTLIENLPNDWDTDTGDSKPDEKQMARLTWRQNIKHQAKNAFLESIAALGTTTRAIQAIAHVPVDFSDLDLDRQPIEKIKRKEKENYNNGP
ncbi:type I-E CRISPR-associated protein Cse1/CasA [Dehalococcoides mccartyi]|uniref:type I-E CRISPR-associated protein Cse1/CasA n=1 Tax=Dehalococcoides TaxID=61434 RepID=UPI0005B56AE1|nr:MULTISPECIES: type I-E CRISPR-associated protein Cse1/CasA [Dehalococcoides]APH13060.1 type I-E CRISPR-associated protein Cse1/CasA [Dehalococcoides mccartyi]QYY57545.1 type I-E CRISPR-associated protein Cse1/CasA [Dehalococcoides mccartyi]BAQ35285.1 putative CRISPR-associated protein [Dehalococcoides sp. UCH007]